MAAEWKINVTQDEDAMITEIIRARTANPYGPPATKSAVIREGVRRIHDREVKGQS